MTQKDLTTLEIVDINSFRKSYLEGFWFEEVSICRRINLLVIPPSKTNDRLSVIILTKNFKIKEIIKAEVIRCYLARLFIGHIKILWHSLATKGIFKLNKAHLVIKGCQFFKVRSRKGRIIETNFNRRLGINSRQGLRKEGFFLVIDEIFLHFGLLHLINMVIDTFKGTVFQEELETSLFTNLSHSWNIIGLITHEGLKVDELRWSNPHFLHEVVRCEGFKLSHTFFRNLNNCIFVSQLNQVFIPRNNCDLVVLTGIFSHLS